MTLAFQIRSNEGCQPQPPYIWDTAWDDAIGYGDWAYAPPAETYNVGGLQAEAALQTAVILCLFTDAICPPDHPLAYLIEGDDPRGWWGDGVDVRSDLGETPLGSLLWLLQRAQATEANAQWAETFVLQALAPMIGQQSVVTVNAQATLLPPNRLDIAIQLYGQNGKKIYAQQFADIWQEAISGPFWSKGRGFSADFQAGFD